MANETPPKSQRNEMIALIKDCAVAVAAALAAIAALLAFAKEQLANYDFTQPRTWLFAGITALIIMIIVGLPTWRARRRQAWLIEIGKGASRKLPVYFRLTPRDAADHDTFQRGDRAHEQALRWIQDAEDHPHMFLTGRSGVGKSSLLAAYVIPELRELSPPFVVLEARGYADPLGALLAVLLKPGAVWQRPPAIDDPSDALERAAKHVSPRRLLIVIDQFEEFVILNDPDQQKPLREFLLALEAQPIKGAQILFSARSDREYLAELQALGLGRMTLNENWFVVDGFEPSEARMFLEGSVLKPSDRWMRAMLREAREIEEGGNRLRPVVLNLLGLILQDGSSSDVIRLKEGGLIRNHLESVLRSPDVSDTAPHLLGQMITDAGTKRPMREEALEKQAELPAGVARGCLSLLSGKRGLVREIDRETRTWEVSHDFIARALGQALGRLRPGLSDHLKKMVGPVALGLWLLGAFGAIPLYYSIYLPQQITKNGVDLVWENDGWTVRVTDPAPEGAKLPEFNRIMPLLRQLSNVSRLEIANQLDVRRITLVGLDELTSLEVSQNASLTSLDIPQLASLTLLEVSQNASLTSLDIPQLASLTSLRVLDNDALTSMDIPPLPSLTWLDVSGNEALTAFDVPPLPSLTWLKVMNNNALTGLDIPELPSLTSLLVSSNEAITALDIPQLVSLTSLRVSRNHSLTALDIPQLTNLTSLEVPGNASLTSLSIPQLTNLTSLRVSRNDALTALDIPQLTNLTSLEVSLNASLTSLNIPQLTNLSELVVWENADLKVLEIPQLTNLSKLYVIDNDALMALDIPQLTNLTSLEVSLNASLTSLNIPQLTNLTELAVWENGALTALDIPQLDRLTVKFGVEGCEGRLVAVCLSKQCDPPLVQCK